MFIALDNAHYAQYQDHQHHQDCCNDAHPLPNADGGTATSFNSSGCGLWMVKDFNGKRQTVDAFNGAGCGL